MATYSSLRAWKIPWTEKPGGLQSMGVQRAGHDWSDLAPTCTSGNPSGSRLILPLWDHLNTSHSRDGRNQLTKERKETLFPHCPAGLWQTAAFRLRALRLPDFFRPETTSGFLIQVSPLSERVSLPAGSQVLLMLLKPNWSRGSEMSQPQWRVR